jgi:hypothetical protein
MGGDSLLAFFEYPKGIAKADRDAIGGMQHVSFACGPTRYREILERLKANGVTINAGPLLVILPAIHSFYFFDPNGIRLEVSSDLDGDEEDLQVIRSCSMRESELRAELETISTDKAWIDDMLAAMTPHGLGPIVPSAPDCRACCCTTPATRLQCKRVPAGAQAAAAAAAAVF